MIKLRKDQERQRAVLRILEKRGPLQTWELDKAFGARVGSTLPTLLRKGCVKRRKAKNTHPPGPHRWRMVWSYSFVRYPSSGIPPSEIARAVRTLRSLGYDVTLKSTKGKK